MPKLKNVEKRIWDIEGFDVMFRHHDGRDVRGDLDDIPQYPFQRMAKNDMTVTDWMNTRFNQTYPGFQGQVLDGSGQQVPGQTHLGTVRDTYSDD